MEAVFSSWVLEYESKVSDNMTVDVMSGHCFGFDLGLVRMRIHWNR